jgi:hypothetical protein
MTNRSHGERGIGSLVGRARDAGPAPSPGSVTELMAFP